MATPTTLRRTYLLPIPASYQWQFSSWSRVSRFPLGFLPPSVPGENLRESVVQDIYGPDVLLRHLKVSKEPIKGPICGLASTFLHPSPDCWANRLWPHYASSPRCGRHSDLCMKITLAQRRTGGVLGALPSAPFYVYHIARRGTCVRPARILVFSAHVNDNNEWLGRLWRLCRIRCFWRSR